MPPLLVSLQNRRGSLQRELLVWQLGSVLLLLAALAAGTLWLTERHVLSLMTDVRQQQAGALFHDTDLTLALQQPGVSSDQLSDWLGGWRSSAGAALLAAWPMSGQLAFDADDLGLSDALISSSGKARVREGSGIVQVGAQRYYWQAEELYGGQKDAGLVLAAFELPSRSALLLATARDLWPWLLLALLLALGSAALLARRLRRVTLDLEPHDLAALSVGQGRLLSTVRDGVIGLDAAGTITLANENAARWLHLQQLPARVDDVWPALARLDLRHETRQIPLPLGGQVMRLNVTPLAEGGGLVAFDEWQEAARLAEELTHTRELVGAMRARAHEYGNRLHVVAGFLQLGQPQQALGVIQEELDAEQQLGEALARIHEPRLAALIAGKMARARELRLTLTLGEDSELPPTLPPDQAEALLTALGNYLQNALDALRGQPGGQIRLDCGVDPDGLSVEVRDNGPGLPADLTPFVAGQTSKGAGHGNGLAATAALCRAAGGEVWTARQGEWTVFGVNFPAGNG